MYGTMGQRQQTQIETLKRAHAMPNPVEFENIHSGTASRTNRVHSEWMVRLFFGGVVASIVAIPLAIGSVVSGVLGGVAQVVGFAVGGAYDSGLWACGSRNHSSSRHRAWDHFGRPFHAASRWMWRRARDITRLVAPSYFGGSGARSYHYPDTESFRNYTKANEALDGDPDLMTNWVNHVNQGGSDQLMLSSCEALVQNAAAAAVAARPRGWVTVTVLSHGIKLYGRSPGYGTFMGKDTCIGELVPGTVILAKRSGFFDRSIEYAAVCPAQHGARCTVREDIRRDGH